MALNPTDVLRAGTPGAAEQSSGAAITALLADTGSPEMINFVFSASEPTAAQQATAANQRVGLPARRRDRHRHGPDRGGQHDHERPGRRCRSRSCSASTPACTRSGTSCPATRAGRRRTIIPVIPPSGSSIYKTFIADLTTANGGTAPTLASA